MATVQTTTPAPVVRPENGSLTDYAKSYVGRVRGGEMGSLPAIAGLIALSIVFTILRPVFFGAYNFANLFTQGAQITIIAMGLVFVLLLGEIDLSAGFASGVCATILAVLLTNHHMPWPVAVLASLGTGLVIGVVLGLLVSKVGIPSFVVTLAAFLAFQGVALLFLSGGTNITIFDSTILAIENKNMPVWLGWVLLAACVAGYAGILLMRMRDRGKRGLTTDPLSLIAVKVGAMIVIGGLAVYVLSIERSPNPPRLLPNGTVLGVSLKGIPIIVPIVAILLLIGTFVLSRTKYGRHIYAVGGNKEAARRAGINVDAIRISVFVICSFMAAIGGIVAVSRANSVDPNTGGSNVLLYAVGAAVIGGTSLFGGKGRLVDAIFGGAVVAVISNGMGLLGYSSGIQFIVTGIVLLLAAGVDALSRKRAAASGLR
jgi:D-xylose transport system permease protein